MTVGGTQVLPSVSTGNRAAVPRQARWCAVQKVVNCHYELEKYPVRNVKPVKFVVQYLTQAAVKLPSGGDNKHSGVQHTL